MDEFKNSVLCNIFSVRGKKKKKKKRKEKKRESSFLAIFIENDLRVRNRRNEGCIEIKE